jgi:hypothetical protein
LGSPIPTTGINLLDPSWSSRVKLKLIIHPLRIIYGNSQSITCSGTGMLRRAKCSTPAFYVS